jgi:hypothetical protein
VGGRAAKAAFIASLLLVVASSVPAQEPGMHDHAATPGSWWSAGASAIALVTRVDPAIANRTLTEGYLTQPLVHARVVSAGDLLELRGMLDFEGKTLARGELTPGAFGEGYVDRRHPHTYLHELVATARTPDWRDAAASVSVGKGFAPFGTDDPMSRPIVRFPVNHHLSQILERFVAIGALRWRPLVVEAGRFNGDEPENPSDAPNSRTRFNSWATRLTLRPGVQPLRGVEFQWSTARVRSPESPTGRGFDHHKRSASGRLERSFGGIEVYALGEWARSDLYKSGSRAFTLTSALGEASITKGIIRVAARYEQTVRPEDERLTNAFRTIFPTAEVQILGTTRFKVATVNLEARQRLWGVSTSPFVEVSFVRAHETTSPAAFVPREFYGSNGITQLSAGFRMSIGMTHARMGRYGIAAAPDVHTLSFRRP